MATSLEVRSIELRVSDLAQRLDFYTHQLGFTLVSEGGGQAALGTSKGGPVILTLLGDPAASPAPHEAAGLFHAALLLPSRASLGAWFQEASDRKVSFQGFADHGVSEAVYLSDPEGNGLEFYADRPRESWPRQAGALAMYTEPLDMPGLIAAGKGLQGHPLPADARWGHLHLRVADLVRSEAFYRSTLGVEVTQASYPGARFLATDGYHHQLGINTWSRSRRPSPPGALGLARATFARTGIESDLDVRDPDGIALRIKRIKPVPGN